MQRDEGRSRQLALRLRCLTSGGCTNVLQVNLYLAAPGHPLFGIARGVVKDGNDTTDSVFVDSDGSVNGNRLLGDLAGPNMGT